MERCSVVHGVLVDWEVNPRNARARVVLVGYRLTRALRCSGRARARLLGKAVDVAYRFLSQWVVGVEIPWMTDIGPRLRLPHPHGVVLNAYSRIGSDVVIRHGVTIGGRRGSFDCPVIGDRVDIGAGASIVGDIPVGDDARIGVAAVVLHPVPPRGSAYGNPAVVRPERVTRDVPD
jgi:putative colanic acid biosynthesis acetyltransferase WcaB